MDRSDRTLSFGLAAVPPLALLGLLAFLALVLLAFLAFAVGCEELEMDFAMLAIDLLFGLM
jgi:hypothetical protein